MRKHFLILMLLALLPLAGWAADPVDLTKATVTFTWGDGVPSRVYARAAFNTIALPEAISITPEGSDVAIQENTDENADLTFAWVNANDVEVTGTATEIVGKYYLKVATAGDAYAGSTIIRDNYFEVTAQPLEVAAKAEVNKTYGFVYSAADFYTITANADFTADGGVEELGDPVDAVWANDNDPSAGVKNFTIVGNTFTNYVVTIGETKKSGVLNIAKKPLLVRAADKECTYKDGTVIDAANWTYTYPEGGFIAADLEEDGITPKNGVLTYGDAIIKNQASQLVYDGNAGYYSVTPTVTSANYDITTQAGTLHVIPRNLNAEGIVYTLSGFDTYNGYDQTPTLAVTDGDEVVDPTQFVVQYKVLQDNEPTGEFLTAIHDAGDYRAYISAAAEGSNYDGVPVEKNINLKQAALIAKFLGYTKLYDGTEVGSSILNGTQCLYIDGYLGNDNATSVFADPYVKPSISGTYTDATTAEGTTLTPANGTAKNYEFIYQSGKLIINKAKVKIVLKDVEAGYGSAAAEPTEWTNLITNIYEGSTKTAADVNFGTFVDKVYVQTGVENDAPVYSETPATTFNVLKKTTAKKANTNDDYDYVKGSTITREEGTDVKEGGYDLTGTFTADAFTKNYTFGTVVDAKFTITPAAIEIKANPDSKTYGTADPTLSYTWPTVLDEAEKANVSISRVQGENVGTYTITVSGPAIIGNHAVTYKTAPFIITKANLTVTAKSQTLYTGQKEANLDKKAFDTEGLVAKDQADIEAALVFSFAPAVSIEEGTGELELAPEVDNTTYEEGVVIALDDDVENEAATRIRQNYNVTLANGDLLVLLNTVNTLILNRPLRDAWNAEATDIAKDLIAAADPEEAMRVTFGDFTMYKEKWYALVLPFNTSVAEVSQKFGYAIVDILNTDNNKNAVSFKLYMQDIAANTPFIIKVYKDMNMNTVVFANKRIVNPTDDELVQTDMFGNKFTGTYTAKNGTWIEGDDAWLAGQDYMFSVNKDKNTYAPAQNGVDAAHTSYLNPVSAYITYKNAQNANSHEAILYIEEPDGSTTAIREVNGQVVEGDVNGWYTINGMKLETVPTQKGIYINNGKKIVIK